MVSQLPAGWRLSSLHPLPLVPHPLPVTCGHSVTRAGVFRDHDDDDRHAYNDDHSADDDDSDDEGYESKCGDDEGGEDEGGGRPKPRRRPLRRRGQVDLTNRRCLPPERCRDMTPTPRDDRHTRHVGAHAPSQPVPSPRRVTAQASHRARASSQPTPAAAHGPCRFAHAPPRSLTPRRVTADAVHAPRCCLTRALSQPTPAAAHGPRRCPHTPRLAPSHRAASQLTPCTRHVAASHAPPRSLTPRRVTADALHAPRCCLTRPASFPHTAPRHSRRRAHDMSPRPLTQRCSRIVTPSHVAGHSPRQLARTGHVTAHSPHNVITTTQKPRRCDLTRDALRPTPAPLHVSPPHMHPTAASALGHVTSGCSPCAYHNI
ncbi:hypothetical protein BKA70DRAFT_1428756 [Coprinopsis sp. MPI-PUGE-AT-0042]|nr:hypothetical protein BKA70DRAFT_1428756 [Coprinopsis sp. MPI-PUGE-AT-0042]